MKKVLEEEASAERNVPHRRTHNCGSITKHLMAMQEDLQTRLSSAELASALVSAPNVAGAQDSQHDWPS
jgi:hypothetical protein